MDTKYLRELAEEGAALHSESQPEREVCDGLLWALAEIERLKPDAERYDWLRHRAPFGPTRRPVVWMTVSHDGDTPDTHETWLDCEDLDDAVDEAMRGA